MDNTQRFTTKADVYAVHRWDYAPEAFDLLITQTGLTAADWVADIGSGTGMVARRFVERGIRTYAVEPNAAMRQYAEATLSRYPAFTSIDAVSDATGLPRHSVALITVGRALHWLPPESTRREFQRILKPGGWLATLGVATRDEAIDAATHAIRTDETGWATAEHQAAKWEITLADYVGSNPIYTIEAPGVVTETWPQFSGRMLSFSSAPDPEHPLYDRYLAAAQAIFTQFAVDGLLTIQVATLISFAQLDASTASAASAAGQEADEQHASAQNPSAQKPRAQEPAAPDAEATA